MQLQMPRYRFWFIRLISYMFPSRKYHYIFNVQKMKLKLVKWHKTYRDPKVISKQTV